MMEFMFSVANPSSQTVLVSDSMSASTVNSEITVKNTTGKEK